jgi:hypothetical protein
MVPLEAAVDPVMVVVVIRPKAKEEEEEEDELLTPYQATVEK